MRRILSRQRALVAFWQSRQNLLPLSRTTKLSDVSV
jgi:hypothetical protein